VCRTAAQPIPNPLGTARAIHKQLLEEVAVCNLPAAERFERKNLLLVGASRASAYKELGMARIVSGVDPDGKQHSNFCHAADMRKQHVGRRAQIPDDDNGGWREIELHAWDITAAGDMLTLNALVPYQESPHANKCCRKCLHDVRHRLAYRPYSHHRPIPECAECEDDETTDARMGSFPLRTIGTLKAQLDTMCGARTKKDLERLSDSYGIKITKIRAYAWNPEYNPLVDPTDIPEDGLHLFGDGLLRSEGAWCVFDLCKNGKLSWAKLFRACRRYSGYPPDVRVPPLHPKILTGAAGGRPRSDAVLRMTGSQVHHFALHRCAAAACATIPPPDPPRDHPSRLTELLPSPPQRQDH
jgi:hypothetical protein